MGYSTSSEVYEDVVYYDLPTVPMFPYKFHCYYRSKNLSECNKYTHQCSSSHKQLTVMCEERCNHGSVRLAGHKYYGQVQVCINGSWVAVKNSNKETVKVICTQLGYKSFGWDAQNYDVWDLLNHLDYNVHFEIAPTAITNMVCFGNETSVLNCSYSVFDQLYSDWDYFDWWSSYSSLVVSCQEGEYPQSTCNDGDVRLVDGANELQGRVEICHKNVWGTVCSNYHSTRNNENFGNLICKQLGYQETGSLVYGHSYFGYGDDPVMMINPDCDRDDSNLLECNQRIFRFDFAPTDCGKNEIQGLLCESQVQCKHGSVQLAGTGAISFGRVDVCINGLWSTICDHYWTVTEASIICSQLGFYKQDAEAITGSYIDSAQPFGIHKLKCTGNEESIWECMYDLQTVSACKQSDDASVHCKVIKLSGSIQGVYGNGCNRSGFLSEDTNLCVRNGESVLLSCENKMNYSHYQIIGPNGISSVDNSLHITSYSSMNEGKYVCTAAGLEEQTSINLVSPLMKPTLIPVDGNNQVISIRNSSTVISFTTLSKNHMLKYFYIKWQYSPSFEPLNVIELQKDSKHSFSSDKLTLTISNTQITDIGLYSIVVSDDTSQSVTNITLKDVYIEVAIKQRFGVSYLKETGSSVQFNCTADGNPRPKIVWRFNGHPLIRNTTRHTISYIHENEAFRSLFGTKQISSYLNISLLNSNDNGSYSCRADNEANRPIVMVVPYILSVKEPKMIDLCNPNPCVEGICGSFSNHYFCYCYEGYSGKRCNEKIIIKVPPAILAPPVNTVGELYSQVTLMCEVSGVPEPKVTWFNDNVTIINDNRDPSRLIINELDLDDRGFYHCEASSIINGEEMKVTSKPAIVNIQHIVQYEALIEIPKGFLTSDQVRRKRETGSKKLDDLIRSINDQLSGSDLTSDVSFFLVEILNEDSIDFNDHPKLIPIIPILITLVTIRGGSEDLLVQVTKEMEMLEMHLNINMTLQNVDRFDGCRTNKTLITSPSGNPDLTIEIPWPETNIGEVAEVKCPCGNITLGTDALVATRYCGGDFTNGGKWSDPHVSPCNFSDLSREICNLVVLEADKRISRLDEITSEASTLKKTEIAISVSVLITVTEDVSGNLALSNSFLSVVDNILQGTSEALKESQRNFNTSAKILEAIQSVADSIPIENTSQPVIIARSQFAVSAQEVEPNQFIQTFSFTAEDHSHISNISRINLNDLYFGEAMNKSTASISLPNNLFNALHNISKSRVTHAIYLSESAFLRRENSNLEVSSVIISASVVGAGPIKGLKNTPVILSFKIFKTDEDPICSFWDPTLDSGYGNWSNIGCYVNSSNDDEVICHCDHLTSFSILLDVSPSIEPVKSPFSHALNVVSYIGIIISLFCLIIVSASYLYSRKLRNSEHGQLLMNLCFALMGLYLSFICALHSTPVIGLCAFFSALLQYFFFVTFMSMTAEAINLYFKLVVVLGYKISHYVIKAVSVSWVLPLFIVVFCFAPKYKNYVSQHFCRVFNAPYYVGMVVPFLIFYIFNWTIFGVIFVSLIHKRFRSSVKKTDKKSKNSFLHQQLIVVTNLSVLFGLGWGVGLLATQDAHSSETVRDILSAMFVLITAFHGLFIFIMNGIRSKDVRNVWKQWFKLATRKNFDEFSSSTILRFRSIKERDTANHAHALSFTFGRNTLQRSTHENPYQDGKAVNALYEEIPAEKRVWSKASEGQADSRRRDMDSLYENVKMREKEKEIAQMENN